MFGSLQLRRFSWPLPVSAVVHATALAALLWAGMPRTLPVPPEQPIAVDILTKEQFEALTQPPAPPQAAAPQPMLASPSPVAEAVPEAAAPPSESAATPQTVHATKFFSAGILADPANKEIAETLPLLAGDEQVIQLCNMEALEQLRVAEVAELPDTVVGYAYGDMTIAGGTLTADGGAFRSAGHWFHVHYHCTASADARAVSAFDFTVGDPIPESEWEEHALNADDDWLD